MPARELLRHVDAAWLHMDRPRNTADIVALLTLDRPLPFARLRAILRERLLPHTRFRERVVEAGPLGAPAWEREPHFSLDRHLVRERDVDPDDDVALSRLAGEVASAPLDPARSPWRVHVVEGRGGACVLVAKLHHCLADGFALVALLYGLSDERFVPMPRRRRPRRGHLEAHLAAAGQGLAGGLPAIAAAAAAFARSLARMALLPQTPAIPPLTGVRGVAWSHPWPVRTVRVAAREAGTSVNDLLVAALAGALRRIPVAGGGARALVPVNLRPVLPDPNGADALGNRFGLVFLDLPVEEATPAARLARVRERTHALKRSPDAKVTYTVLGALGLAPRPVEQAGVEFFSRKASLVITNVPGPRRPLHLGRRRINRIMFWVPHPAALGVGVSLFSYAGQLTMGVRADTSALSDPAALVAAFEEELAALAPRPAGLENGRVRPVPAIEEGDAPTTPAPEPPLVNVAQGALQAAAAPALVP